MPILSSTSVQRLQTCTDNLKKVFAFVGLKRNITITCGHRDQKEQDRLFAEGKTQRQWPEGEHNKLPSNAVDVVPIVSGTVPWPKMPDLTGLEGKEQRQAIIKYAKDMGQFYHLAGYVQGVGDSMGVTIRFGGDWDMDNNLQNNRFDDLVHYEEKV